MTSDATDPIEFIGRLFEKRDAVHAAQKRNIDHFVTNILISLTLPNITDNNEPAIDSDLVHKLSDITSYYSSACHLNDSSLDAFKEKTSEFEALINSYREILSSANTKAVSEKVQFVKSEVIKMIDEELARIATPAEMKQQAQTEAVGELKDPALAASREARAT